MTGSASPTGRWLVDWAPPATASHIVLCLAEAGGGAAQFRRLQEELGDDLQVVAVQLPGRQERWREPVVTRMEELLGRLVPALLNRLDRPYVVFGQSMGAMIGYELARLLGGLHGCWPVALVACGAVPPGLLTPSEVRRVTGEAAIRGRLAATAAASDFDEELDQEVAELLLRPLRADAALIAAYRHESGSLLPCPLHVWSGADDQAATPEQLARWREHTRAGFRTRTFPGGHVFLSGQERAVATSLRDLVGLTGQDSRHD